MAEVDPTFSAPPGLDFPEGWTPPGMQLPPGLASSSPLKVTSEEGPAVKPPPGLEGPPPGLEGAAAKAGRSRAKGVAKGAASSSCSTSAGSVTTEEPPEEGTPAYVAADLACAARSEEARSSYVATISGLPNLLLTDIMFEAVLEQASLSHLVESFSLHPSPPGKKQANSHGHAKVSFISMFGAESCAQHFSGCNWGVQVAVSLDIKECQENDDWEPAAAAFFASDTDLSLEDPAKAFVLGTPSALSSEAPIFVPSTITIKSQATSSSEVEAKPMTRTVSSDTSTEVGESDQEGEQDASGVRRRAAGLSSDQAPLAPRTSV